LIVEGLQKVQPGMTVKPVDVNNGGDSNDGENQ